MTKTGESDDTGGYVNVSYARKYLHGEWFQWLLDCSCLFLFAFCPSTAALVMNQSIDHFAPTQEAISDENESEQAQMLRSNAPLKTISDANVLIAALII